MQDLRTVFLQSREWFRLSGGLLILVYYIHYDMSHNKHERENCHFYVAHPPHSLCLTCHVIECNIMVIGLTGWCIGCKDKWAFACDVKTIVKVWPHISVLTCNS